MHLKKEEGVKNRLQGFLKQDVNENLDPVSMLQKHCSTEDRNSLLLQASRPPEFSKT